MKLKILDSNSQLSRLTLFAGFKIIGVIFISIFTPIFFASPLKILHFFTIYFCATILGTTLWARLRSLFFFHKIILRYDYGHNNMMNSQRRVSYSFYTTFVDTKNRMKSWLKVLVILFSHRLYAHKNIMKSQLKILFYEIFLRHDYGNKYIILAYKSFLNFIQPLLALFAGFKLICVFFISILHPYIFIFLYSMSGIFHSRFFGLLFSSQNKSENFLCPAFFLFYVFFLRKLHSFFILILFF